MTDFIDNIDPEVPILIAGPTASGKSSLAMDLAAKFNGRIVNADALQVYSCWRVLSARPNIADEKLFPHDLYGHLGYEQPYSVGNWLREVQGLLSSSNDRLPIIVGGTGLYFSALANGLAEIPEIPSSVRQHSTSVLEKDGLSKLLDDLGRDDPITLDRLDTQNPMRVQRAWEVFQATGKGLSQWQAETPQPLLPVTPTNAFVLDAPKEWLNPRIENRFSNMITDGCVSECMSLLPKWNPDLPASRAIGAVEIISHLKGEITLDQAISDATLATRQYAKRQRSWFRARMKDWTWLRLSTGGWG